MATYLLIESRDPFESREVTRTWELAAGLARDKNQVTLLLIENGVFAARESLATDELSRLAKDGVTVLAERFSLSERGITDARIAGPVKSASLDVVVEHLEHGHKVLWH